MPIHIKYILCSLFLSLPVVTWGQVVCETAGWDDLLMHGGTIRTLQNGHRTGRHYLRVDDGLSSLLAFNYVDGTQYGPSLTWGYVAPNYGRYELDTELRYAESRKVWQGAAALRYMLPPQYYSSVELFYRHRSTDYDSNSLPGDMLQQMGAVLCGWNGVKRYDAEQVGGKFSMAMTRDVQLEGSLWYEEREQLNNYRKRNWFGKQGEDNLPQVRGVLPQDALLNWGHEHAWRASASITYKPGRTLVCYNDLQMQEHCTAPAMKLNLEYGNGSRSEFMSIEAQIEQTIGPLTQALTYVVRGGCYPWKKGQIGLMDRHHFDATHFAFQQEWQPAMFSLLSNYELSTADQWLETHVEWQTDEMLLSRLVDESLLMEYVQLHAVAVAHHRPHYELAYGWDLSNHLLRIGTSVGFDGRQYDGVALNVCLNINLANAMDRENKKKK